MGAGHGAVLDGDEYAIEENGEKRERRICLFS